MQCPYCAQNHDRVVDSRENRDGATLRRRRTLPAGLYEVCERRPMAAQVLEVVAAPLRAVEAGEGPAK